MSEKNNPNENIISQIRRRPFMATIVGALALVVAYFLLWPVPFDPVAGPPRAANPAGTGVFAKNNDLAAAEMIETGDGPEGIALDQAGRIYTGLNDGRIVRVDDSGNIEELANTGGRPLGIEFDAAGNLIIADAVKGLMSMAPDGTLTVLASEYENVPMIFVNDVAIADDGKIYFSDASTRHGYGSNLLELFERKPSGRLLVYDPSDGSLKLLLDNLYFANGVAMGHDRVFLTEKNDTYVLVNETFEHRITRYWLTGSKAGKSEVFADNLPGYLDNITEAPDGGFWLAIVAPRLDNLDALVDKPFLRKIVWRFSQLTGSSPSAMHSYAVKLDARGEPVASLEDDSGHIFMMTSVIESGGRLYLGSLLNQAIGVIDAPKQTAP